MQIIADLAKGQLYAGEAVFPISNRVRTVREGSRASHEVVKTIPGGLPYDPQNFPKGSWEITGVDWQKEKGFDPHTYGPVKIRTNASCTVKVWELDADGDYFRETEKQVQDTCYWLHYSSYSTTLGCIRLASPEDACKLAEIVRAALKSGPVQLEAV